MSTDEALNHLWYVRLPRSLGPVAPRLAAAIGDGVWTSVWARLAAWTPLVVFVLGWFVPSSWPGIGVAYTESAPFVAVAAGLSILNGTWGVALLCGHGLRVALSRDVASSLNAVLSVGAGQLVAWLLLAVLVVMLSQFARLATEAAIVRLPFLRQRDLRAVCRGLLLAGVYTGLVLAWCQAAPVLVRPVFTWSGGSLPVDAMAPLWAWWPWMATAAATGAFVRAMLEGVVVPRVDTRGRVDSLLRQRPNPSQDAGRAWDHMPASVRTTLCVAGMTLLLAGVFEQSMDALIGGLTIGLLAMLTRGLGGWLAGSWVFSLRRIPGAARVAVALAGGYLVTDQVVAFGLTTTPMRAMLIGTLATLTLLCVLFPAVNAIPRRVPAARTAS